MSKRNGYEITINNPEATEEIRATIEQTGLVITNVKNTQINAEDAIRAGEVHENGPAEYIYKDEVFNALQQHTDSIEQLVYEYSNDTSGTRTITTYTVEDGEFVKIDEEETRPSRFGTRT